MKFLKRFSITILIFISASVLFRGWIFRALISYEDLGDRINYTARNEFLIRLISKSETETGNVKDIIDLSLSLTSDHLEFTSGKNANDPDILVQTRKAHCVGYAAFFAATCNYLLLRNNLAGTWSAKPRIGKLYLLGENIHHYFSSSFFEDHDFVIIENKLTGEVFAVDPSVNDYLKIDYVTLKK